MSRFSASARVTLLDFGTYSFCSRDRLLKYRQPCPRNTKSFSIFPCAFTFKLEDYSIVVQNNDNKVTCSRFLPARRFDKEKYKN